jgi:hypothetical protein
MHETALLSQGGRYSATHTDAHTEMAAIEVVRKSLQYHRTDRRELKRQVFNNKD